MERETEYKVACRTGVIFSRFFWRVKIMREASAERENAFIRRVCLALHARFVAKKIATILQGVNKGVAVKQGEKIKGDLRDPLLNCLPIVRAGSKR